jgi:hypothetical protein
MESDNRHGVFTEDFQINWDKLDEFMDYDELEFGEVIEFLVNNPRLAVNLGIFVTVREPVPSKHESIGR